MRQGSPDENHDEDAEAKLLFEFLADKHGFQSKDSTPDGEGDDEKTAKTFEEWKAERNRKKTKNQIQEEQVGALLTELC